MRIPLTDPSSLLRCGFLLALVFVFGVSLLPAPEQIDLSDGGDKIGHFVAFAMLALLGYAAWPERAGLVSLGLLVYGGAIEIAQSATPYRQGDWADWLADAGGMLATLAAWTAWRALRRRLRTERAEDAGIL